MFDSSMDKIYKEFEEKNAKNRLKRKSKPVVETENDIKIKKFHKGTELFQSLDIGQKEDDKNIHL